jgi:hypothetical protein
MNVGAGNASGEVFYFVHADVKLLPSFASDILEVLAGGFDAGCYRYRFDSGLSMLKVNAYFTRFNLIACRGGDQTLFIKRQVFETLRGFNESFVIMEDYEFIERIQKSYSFHVVPKSIIVSARKYATNSWLRVQLANLTVFMMYFLKRPPLEMASKYREMLDYRPIPVARDGKLPGKPRQAG